MPSSDQKRRAQQHGRACKKLRGQIFAIHHADQLATNWRSNQASEADNGEHHAHSNTQLTHIQRQGTQGGRKQTLKATSCNATYTSPGIDTTGVVDSWPAKQENTCTCSNGDE